MPRQNPAFGEKHSTATVFVVTDDKPSRVLLVHHKKFDKWMPPGGHQEALENSYEAAIREVREETGIDITPFLPKPTQLYMRASNIPLPDYILEEKIDAHGEQAEHYHLDMIYVVRVPQQEATHAKSESHSIGWFTKEEAEKLPTFDNVIATIRSVLSS